MSNQIQLAAKIVVPTNLGLITLVVDNDTPADKVVDWANSEIDYRNLMGRRQLVLCGTPWISYNHPNTI